MDGRWAEEIAMKRSEIEKEALKIWQEQYDEIGYGDLGPIKLKNKRWGCDEDLILSAIVAALLNNRKEI